MFKGLANLGSILKQAHQIRGQMDELGDKLKTRRTTGSSGGGMVEIEVNGLMEVLRVSIDEKLASGGDRELLEDLVAAAMNETIRKGKELHAEALQELTGGLQLPGLQDAMAKFMGANVPEGDEGEGGQKDEGGKEEGGESEEPEKPDDESRLA